VQLSDVHSLDLVAFGDCLGCPVRTGPEVDDDARWPWVLMVLAAGVVVLGAICFTPDSGGTQQITPQCLGSTCASVAESAAPRP
jgi:hypothetical protein